MKIAIATLSDKEDSEISSMAGRTPFFLVFEEKKLIETIKNPFRFGSGGAGPAAAKLLAEKGVKKIIAGKFGPNMIIALEQRGLKYEMGNGKASEVLKE